MGRIYKDRVGETCVAPGTGNFGLAGALAGYQTFAGVAAVGDTFDYSAFAVDVNGVPNGGWETGTGTFAAGDQISRVPQESSNANALVNFGAGTTVVVILSENAASIATLAAGGGGGGTPVLYSAALDNPVTGDNTPVPGISLSFTLAASTEVIVDFGLLYHRSSNETRFKLYDNGALIAPLGGSVPSYYGDKKEMDFSWAVGGYHATLAAGAHVLTIEREDSGGNNDITWADRWMRAMKVQTISAGATW